MGSFESDTSVVAQKKSFFLVFNLSINVFLIFPIDFGFFFMCAKRSKVKKFISASVSSLIRLTSALEMNFYYFLQIFCFHSIEITSGTSLSYTILCIITIFIVVHRFASLVRFSVISETRIYLK